MEEYVDEIRERVSEIRIVGVGDADLGNVDDLLSNLLDLGDFQILDGNMVLGREHVRFAVMEAVRCYLRGESITESLSMEVLVKAACTTQISDAIDLLGVKRSSTNLVLVGIDVSEKDLEKAVSLTRGHLSEGSFMANPEKKTRLRKSLGLSEPLEKSLIERIAMSGIR